MKKRGYIEIYRLPFSKKSKASNKNPLYYFRIKAANGKTMAVSNIGYSTKYQAESAIDRLLDIVYYDPIVKLEKF